MQQFFEMLMLLAFGFAWPMSIYKSYTARTAKGKSLIFSLVIIFGYICGITAKIVENNITYVMYFYILNLIMVSIDACLYFRNKHLDSLKISSK